MSSDSFLKLYSEVFDENDKVKLCGREKCKDLIICCMSLSKGNFGNKDNGMMNIDNIIALKKELYN